MTTSSSVESCTVETSDKVKLHTRIFKPNDEPKDDIVIVIVHPYSVLGGSQGLLRGIAVGLAEKGYTVVTFDMRGAGRSSGWASITGSSEIIDVISVCKWVSDNLSADRILLVGSSAGIRLHVKGCALSLYLVVDVTRELCALVVSVILTIILIGGRLLWVYLFHPHSISLTKAHVVMFLVKGAPISGSAVDQIDHVRGYVSLGYPFGLAASILFGRHHKAILKSTKPKLFVMGTKDGFTSVKQLENKLKTAAGRVETHLIEGVGHFQMEGPSYDAQMVGLIIGFIASL
ncbi:hypothetical protein IFM89_016360 [Coptis chinensis]|uniref:Xaa-Pro dipeptidyl-peptidase-like domain-containing protein n=1 Tax=Coptis chinensis TaxID=261450 RepID=A0A835LMT8_9MAGN|nr:hypothetical protein IFM89_016360 [Coptis chinensis]